MATLYHIGQTDPELIVDTEKDISSATEFAILYRTPSGFRGRWTGALDSTTKIKYTLKNTDLLESGTWLLQSYAILGGETNIGVEVEMEVAVPLLYQFP